MVANGGTGRTGPGDWGGTIVPVTGTASATTVTSSDCCPRRFETYTEAKERHKKEKRKKNNPVPPHLRSNLWREGR